MYAIRSYYVLAHYYPEDIPNYVGFEGYLNGRVMVEGLRRAGPDLTRENFINAIETIENYSLGIANPLNFSAQDHQGLENRITSYNVCYTKLLRIAPGPSARVSLRSSALGEDDSQTSFAGQYRSELNISSENIFDVYKA